MKIAIGVMVSMLIMGNAHALEPGNYTEHTNQVETCKTYGQMGGLYYRIALLGRRPTVHDAPWIEPMRQHIEDEIFDHVDSYNEQSAAQFAFSYCWDNIDTLIRSHKASTGGF